MLTCANPNCAWRGPLTPERIGKGDVCGACGEPATGVFEQATERPPIDRNLSDLGEDIAEATSGAAAA